MFDRVWKMLQEIDASERKKVFDEIIELLSASEDEEMLQLRDDLLTFEDDILDDSEDPIKTLLEGEK
jgi:DNA-binding ferritin-like protein (Dps family)